jgi:hypothetical protein
MLKPFAASLLLATFAFSLEAKVGDIAEIEVTHNGVENKKLYAMSDWNNVGLLVDEEGDLHFEGTPWGRTYFVTEMDGDPATDIYFKPNLLGGYMEYDVDLSLVGCGCSAALSLLGMPGLNEDGTIKLDNAGIPSCDGYGNSNAKCPEWRVHMANTFGFKAFTFPCEDIADGNPHIYEECTRRYAC